MKQPTYQELTEHPELVEKCMRQGERERARAAAEFYAELRDALSRALRAMTPRFPKFIQTRAA